MQIIKYFFLFFLFSKLLISSELVLTKQEKEWISNNPTVTLGADHNWPPFDFLDKNKNHSGLASEYLKLISKKTALTFNVKADVWNKTITLAKTKQLDGLTCAVKTKDRDKYFNFTTPYLSVPMAIITHVENKDISTIDDLMDKTVSINRGSYVHEWLKTYYPNIKLYLTNSNEESIEAVSFKTVDAYIGNLAVATYIINKNLLNDLKIVSKFKNFKTSLSIAINKDNKILFNIIQKALNSIDKSENQRIKSIWQKELDTHKKKINFTNKEKEWIKRHPKIRYVIDNNWEPVEYYSNNSFSGISSSYIKYIQEYTGIDFVLIPTKSWAESVVKINNREADFYTCVAKTRSREKVVNFSEPYMKLPQVFITKHDVDLITSIKELYGKKVALVKDYYITELVKDEHKEIDIIEVNNITEALNKVINGDAYAFIEMLPVASYYIQQKGYADLKISGLSEYKFGFSTAIRNDWDKTGIDIINKVIDSIDEEDKNKIYNKWSKVKYEKSINYTLLWQISAIFTFFIIGTFYWNRKLSKEVQKRKLAQNALFEANKKLKIATTNANAANKAKSDFLSNMSHEIRTPMNAILGFTELLDESIEDKRLKSYIKTIKNSGQTLLYLINDILDLSKIESGKLQIINSQVNIKNLLHESIDLFKLKAQQKGLELKLSIDEELPASLLIDSHRLKEILINLIGNAIKFTDNGYVRVSLHVDEVFEHNSKINITIEVQDSGIGIAKKDQENIFNVFEQTENQDVKKYGGTGLGLAISKKLANLMDGSLHVESELGNGSKFIIKLNNIDIASISEVGTDTNTNNSTNYKNILFKNASIMIVDDVIENRELVKESIRSDKLTVYEASNGQEAIEKARELDLDLIFMDIRMPVMNGYTATKKIREFSDVPIVALTASIMQDELDKLNGKKFSGYLRKPVSKSELYGCLTKYIRYNEQKSTIENIEKEQISTENLNNLVKYITKIQTSYNKAISTNDMNTIKEFSELLLQLSQEHNVQSIVNYSKTLLEYIDSFDIDGINISLKEFSKHMEQLKALKEKT